MSWCGQIWDILFIGFIGSISVSWSFHPRPRLQPNLQSSPIKPLPLRPQLSRPNQNSPRPPLRIKKSAPKCRQIRSVSQRVVPAPVSAGRGLYPRPERSTPAKYPPTLPNSSSPPLPNPSHFRSSLQCSRVCGSFRSGVQPPTGTRSGRH